MNQHDTYTAAVDLPAFVFTPTQSPALSTSRALDVESVAKMKMQ